MSYVVLARKYRPRSFDQMVGQPHVVQALGNALAQQRLHHAYLFTGTRGVGKTTISRILAKSLNCTGPDGQGGITAQPCGVCPACTAIDADRFVDYIELDAASNRSIDEIRELIERAAYKPAVGRFKVFMIDEAHQLTKDAFNALLKTLEEPPDYLKFVLATTDPEKMLPTVLSRCLQFNLRPMAPEVLQAQLLKVLQAEGVGSEPGALRLLARAARGSMRDALSLADQAIAYGGGQVDEAVVRAMLGSVDRTQAESLLDALARRDGAALLDEVDVLRREGLSAAATLEAMAGLLQAAAVEQAVPGALDDAEPETPGARALATQMPADELQLLYSIVLQGRSELAADERRIRRLDDGPASPVRLSRGRGAARGAASEPAAGAARTGIGGLDGAGTGASRVRRALCLSAAFRRPGASRRRPGAGRPLGRDGGSADRSRRGVGVDPRTRDAGRPGGAGRTGASPGLALVRGAGNAARAGPGRAPGRSPGRPDRQPAGPARGGRHPGRHPGQARGRRARAPPARRRGIHRCRPGGARPAGTVSGRAHRARFGQTRLTPPERTPTMMKNQLAGLMKQAQAMQDNLKRAQEELAQTEVEGQSGAGLVKVLMTCKHDVRRITIDPSLLADDKDMLEDLVAAAFNDGLRRAEELSAEKMGKLTAGMPLPPGMKLPF